MNAHYTVSPQVTSQVFDDVTVLLDTRSGKFYNLNATASTLWRALDSLGSLSAACAAVQEEFEVEPELAKGHAHESVEEWLRLGLLTVTTESSQ